MGISPIGYRAWKGARANRMMRVWTITEDLFLRKTKSNGLIVLLFLGLLSAHAFQLLFTIFDPPHELTNRFMVDYLSGGTFMMFTWLLAAVVTSDLVSDDLGSNSFVLYFSRPIKTEDYILGKFSGAAMVMGIFCFLAPLAVALATISRQTSSVYSNSLVVLLKTIPALLILTVLFIPLGLMMSSFTKRKAYAGVGTFMSLFVLFIVTLIFSSFSMKWLVLNPAQLVSFTNELIFFGEVSPVWDVSGATVVTVLAAMFFAPLVFLYLRIYSKGVGR